jgi:hypothetical protein
MLYVHAALIPFLGSTARKWQTRGSRIVREDNRREPLDLIG